MVHQRRLRSITEKQEEFLGLEAARNTISVLRPFKARYPAFERSILSFLRFVISERFGRHFELY